MRTILLLVLVCVPVSGLAQEPPSQKSKEKEPSLAELARRERERRAKLKETPVITNATIKDFQGRVGSGTDGTLAETEATAQNHAMKGDRNARLTLVEFTDYQ